MDATHQASRQHVFERSLLLPLRELDAGALPVAGGKAANLGELIAAGLPVPDGFCLTTGAYHDLESAADLTEIVEHRAGAAAANHARSAELAPRARDRTLSPTMPAPVSAAVPRAYRALGKPPVAVRSSATAEDLPFASFAGQQ